MSGAARRQTEADEPDPAVAQLKSRATEDIGALIDYIRNDRFLPIPPSEKNFVGDGDFLAVGLEFLERFVTFGGLAPQDRVLDIGCGIGRMALPLTQYLRSGSYDGIDVAAEGIGWCSANIASRYDNFRFHLIDLAHPLYNPSGAMATSEVRLPFEAASFDFIFMTSVLTHLTTAETRAYAREIRRLLAPNGRCLVTAFLLNPPARAGLSGGKAPMPFDGAATAPEIYAYADNPTAAVAYDEDFLLARFLEFGLRRTRPAIYGRWSGRATPGDSFQDINLLQADGGQGDKR